jgi:ABC-2 type transport system permease protein
MNTTVVLSVGKRILGSALRDPMDLAAAGLLGLVHLAALIWPGIFFARDLGGMNVVLPLTMFVMGACAVMTVWRRDRVAKADLPPAALLSERLSIWLGKYVAALVVWSVLMAGSLVLNEIALAVRRPGLAVLGGLLGDYVLAWLAGSALLAVGAMLTFAALAVFKRNFASYFASPLAYVFICVFVSLTGFAAFWNNEFFSTNLANLNPLNRWFPFIMLVFIPAISMGIWAEERRQATDELLLTIPADDLEIVLGKYLAAVAIYTVSLLYSLLGSLFVLSILGDPDLGLFLATYVGYWLIGLTMLAIGMVASFLTANLTVAFILGVILNAPLVFAVFADSIFPEGVAMAVKRWSFGEQFRDFSRGILSFAGLAYFAMIAAVMLYLSMILIARRHWVRGKDWVVMAGHFAVRLLALAVIIVGANLVFHRYDLRLDATSEQLSSLAPQTKELLANLEIERPVHVDAFISPNVPEGYVQTQLNLRAMLEEFQARRPDRITVRIHGTEQSSEEANQAEKRFKITPRRVFTTSRGTMAEDQIFMGVAFTCGLQTVTVPFIDRGIPVEYELIRSILTVTQQKRKKIGVLQTDAQLFGGFNFQTGSSSRNWAIIDELQKAYEVTQVDANQPITEKYDVLLAVQPSSLGREQMKHFLEAVRSGQPTAIFEDPLPFFLYPGVPGTSAPKRPPMGNPMMMNPAMGEKGDIKELWHMLQIDFSGEDPGNPTSRADQIVCQSYNPFPKLARLPDEFVFVDKGCGAAEPFNQSDPISSKLQHVLFPFPGYVSKKNSSQMDFVGLARTGEKTATVRYGDVFELGLFGMGGDLNPDRRHTPQGVSYTLAARISGKVDPNPADELNKEEGKKEGAAKPGSGQVRVVVVADIDMLHPEFFRIREQGDIPDAGLNLDFDNVTFVLNVLDDLAGDDRFLEIRKRRREHRTLIRMDELTEKDHKETNQKIDELRKKDEKVRQDEEKNLNDNIEELVKKFEKEKMSGLDVLQRREMLLREGRQRIEAQVAQAHQETARAIRQQQRELDVKVRHLQSWCKLWAVVLPPIPPLVLAGVVFFLRRAREREGVARSRLRK